MRFIFSFEKTFALTERLLTTQISLVYGIGN